MSTWWDELRRDHSLILDEENRQSLEITAITYSPMFILSTIYDVMQNETMFKEFEVQVWLINTLAKYKNGALVDFVKPDPDFICSDKTATIIRNTVWQLTA
jgi:hypothetical protein